MTWLGVDSPIPCSALALLAGFDPDPAWMGLGSERAFKLPKSLVETAKLGRLSAIDIARDCIVGKGKSFTLESLSKALGKNKTPAPAKILGKAKNEVNLHKICP